MPTRREILLSSAALTSLLMLPGMKSAQAATPRRGGTLIASTVPEPNGLVSGVTPSNPAVVVSTNLFDGLITYDRDNKPIPQLAESWETTDGGHTITFHLRNGVKWHDGQAFTSADVQYSLMEVTKKFHPRGIANFSQLQAVDTPDPLTAVFRFSRPAPVVWAALHGTETQMLPRHLYAGSDVFANPLNSKPVGNGAFIFKEWVRGSHITLVRNPDYWQKGLPYVDELIFRIIPDAGAREAALEAGEVHYAPLSPVPLSDARRIDQSANVRIDPHGWEANAPVYFFDFNLARKPFDDLRVRQAFAHAIDREALAKIPFFGFARVATGPVPASQKAFYKADTPQYPFDLKKAEALLDDAGLKRGADGTRLKINHLVLPYGDDFNRAGSFMQQQLKRVGIQLTFENLDLSTYLRRIFSDHDFDTMSAYYAAFSDPQVGVIRRFWSHAIQKGVAWGNASGYKSAQMDALVEGINTKPDPAKRVALVGQLQTLAQTDLPSISLLELNFFRAVSRKIDGLDDNPIGVYSSLASAYFKS